jgi:hypothetical protein
MPTALEPPSSPSALPGTAGSLKRKRGWETNILAFAADESSEEDEGDDGGMDEDEGDEQAFGDEMISGPSTLSKGVKTLKTMEQARPLNRDQILMREVSTPFHVGSPSSYHHGNTEPDIIYPSWI